MKRTMLVITALCLAAAAAFGQEGPAVAWGDQLSFCDGFMKVAADRAGNCYIAGTTGIKLDASFGGITDGFVRKYDPDGKALWTIHVGSPESDTVGALAVDRDGNCLVGGKTMGNVGGKNAGSYDAFLVKIGPDGKVIWKKQFGTDKSDVLNGLAVDTSGAVFAVGETKGDLAGKNAGGADVFLMKFDAAGKAVWKTQYGTAYDEGGLYVAPDAQGTIFVLTSGNECVAFDAQGKLKSAHGYAMMKKAWGLATDGAGGVFIGGTTGTVAILAKYDKDWKLEWSKTFGSGSWTGINSLFKIEDGSGDVLAGGCQNWENCFAFVKRFDAQGNEKQVFYLKENDANHTCGQEAAVDGRGNWYLTGFTLATIFKTKSGGQDGFVLKAGFKK
jgi:hypothetical protein